MKVLITSIFLFSVQLFAGIGIGLSPLGDLPVELTSFTAKQSVSGVELHWSTATEVSNYGFDVERNSLLSNNNKIIWEKIGFISGHGNSNSPNNYSFIDSKPLNGKSQYRLKQIDKDGAFKYTKTVEVASVILKYNLAQNYPNPFNPNTVIAYSIPASSHVIINVYNLIGQQIKTLVNEYQEAGSYKVNFDARSLSNGIYFYKIQSGNFVEIKKMLLLK
jgi:hypothetical protein